MSSRYSSAYFASAITTPLLLILFIWSATVVAFFIFFAMNTFKEVLQEFVWVTIEVIREFVWVAVGGPAFLPDRSVAVILYACNSHVRQECRTSYGL